MLKLSDFYFSLALESQGRLASRQREAHSQFNVWVRLFTLDKHYEMLMENNRWDGSNCVKRIQME